MKMSGFLTGKSKELVVVNTGLFIGFSVSTIASLFLAAVIVGAAVVNLKLWSATTGVFRRSGLGSKLI